LKIWGAYRHTVSNKNVRECLQLWRRKAYRQGSYARKRKLTGGWSKEANFNALDDRQIFRTFKKLGQRYYKSLRKKNQPWNLVCVGIRIMGGGCLEKTRQTTVDASPIRASVAMQVC